VDILQHILAAMLLAGYYLIEFGGRALSYIVHYWTVSITLVAIIVAALIAKAAISRSKRY
jgi:hypothetical protein